tara:strand:+ start:762 stop:1103 length:342 start_codon:yes stop_codon:yes gene_type:complete
MSDQIGLKLTKELSDNRKGDFAEFYAVTWLWDQGFDVFKNCGCDGPIDMIAWNKENHDFVLVDVKTMSYDPRYKDITNCSKGVARTPFQKKIGVQFLKFDPYTRKLEFTEHRT